MDFEINLDGIEDEISEFNYVNGVPYLKTNIKLEDNQMFFVTHLEIREKTGKFAGKREMTNLLDTISRQLEGSTFRLKAEKRVKFTNTNHNKNWFIVEVGKVVPAVD